MLKARGFDVPKPDTSGPNEIYIEFSDSESSNRQDSRKVQELQQMVAQ